MTAVTSAAGSAAETCAALDLVIVPGCSATKRASIARARGRSTIGFTNGYELVIASAFNLAGRQASVPD